MMYRIVRLRRGGGHDLLTRRKRSVAGYQMPVWTQNASDESVITYGTKWGALKRQAQLLRDRETVVVIDAATGVEIPESVEARQ